MIRVTAGILIKDDKILIGKRKAESSLAGKWEFPGGKVERGETPEQCLKREMKEEFQIDVSVGAYLGKSIYHYEHAHVILMVYRTFWVRGEIVSTAHDEYQWVSLKQLQSYNFVPADLPFVEKLKQGCLEGIERKEKEDEGK